MKKIILKDARFWDWMDGDNKYNKAGLVGYTDIIVELIGRADYLSWMSNPGKSLEHSKIMNNLSLIMPRRYFLEVQYCAKAYATLFGKLFPTLAVHVDQLAYIEWLLYTEPDNPGYRDHLVHMFKVAFVCEQFLSMNRLLTKVVNSQFQSKHFLEWCDMQEIKVAAWSFETKKKVVKIALFLAGLFHDFGYGYYFHSKYKNKLFKIHQWLFPDANQVDTNTCGTRMMLRSLPSAFVKKYHWWLRKNESKENKSENKNEVVAGFYRDCLPLNHSVASAFFVVDLAESLWRSEALSEQLYVALHLAAEACMIHDMTENDKWVHFAAKNNNNEHFIDCSDHNSIPLAMLLILSDELSVWNRPRLKTKGEGSKSVLYTFETSDVPEKIELLVNETVPNPWIRISANKNSETIKKNFKKLKCFSGKVESENKRSILGYALDIKA